MPAGVRKAVVRFADPPVEAVFDGRRWDCPMDSFEELLNAGEELRRQRMYGYHPDPLAAAAEHAAEQLGGRVVSIDPAEPLAPGTIA